MRRRVPPGCYVVRPTLWETLKNMGSMPHYVTIPFKIPITGPPMFSHYPTDRFRIYCHNSLTACIHEQFPHGVPG